MNSVREIIQRNKTTGRSYPQARAFPRFPLLTEMTYGLHGIFIVVGATGVGKSTLAAHLAAEVVGEDFPGVYYESENTFETEDGIGSFLFPRIGHSYGDDARLDHLAHTTDFEQAKHWLRERTPRGFLVIDTIQGSLDIADHASNLDAGPLRGLERRSKEIIDLTHEGYAVLVVSQTNDRNTKTPPTLGALKGASALEQMAWAVVAYGTSGTKAPDMRAVVLRKMRRPVHQAWPLDSRLLIRTDGLDGLSEAGAARQQEKAPAMSPAELVAQARRDHPGASDRSIAKMIGVPRSTVQRLRGVAQEVAHGPGVGHPVGHPENGRNA